MSTLIEDALEILGMKFRLTPLRPGPQHASAGWISETMMRVHFEYDPVPFEVRADLLDETMGAMGFKRSDRSPYEWNRRRWWKGARP